MLRSNACRTESTKTTKQVQGYKIRYVVLSLYSGGALRNPVEQDVRTLGIGDWKKALDRSRWRGTVKAVKALNGLWCRIRYTIMITNYENSHCHFPEIIWKYVTCLHVSSIYVTIYRNVPHVYMHVFRKCFPATQSSRECLFLYHRITFCRSVTLQLVGPDVMSHTRILFLQHVRRIKFYTN
jgi:hypothetical protein